MNEKNSIAVKKRKRLNSTAFEGKLTVFISGRLKRKVEFMADKERRSLSEIMRIALSLLFSYYAENGGELPKVDETVKMRPGRPRVFNSSEDLKRQEDATSSRAYDTEHKKGAYS